MKIQTEPFRKVSAPAAADICARVDLSEEARAFLVPALSPQAFLALLTDAQLVGDGVRFMAFAMPVREAVWWACIVAQTTTANPTPLEKRCLESVIAWVYEPTEPHRRACFAVAEEAQFQGAAAYAALAAFWSGGSLAPEGMPDASADPKLGPIGAGASVLLSITGGEPASLTTRFEEAIMRAINIANGGNGWLKGERPSTAG